MAFAHSILLNFLVMCCCIALQRFEVYLSFLMLIFNFFCFDSTGVDVKKNVIVAITSDKGLCGGINSTSVKVSRALHKLTSGSFSLGWHEYNLYILFQVREFNLIVLFSGPEKETKYVILGEKGKVQLLRDSKDSIEMTATELQKNPINYTQVCFY
jgi:F-type H+-transporting ATPase subunit gamma